MLSLLLGFASSLVPPVLNLFRQKQDNAHELELAKLNLQLSDSIGKNALATAEISASAALQQATVTADAEIITKADTKVIDLNASVRPAIAFLTIGVFIYAAAQKPELLQVELFINVVEYVLAYYFGQRCFTKRGI